MNDYSLRISGVYVAAKDVNVGVCMSVWAGMQ